MATPRKTKKEKEGLGQFEGRDVRTATVKITNAGDGLSKALGVDPALLHQDEVVFVVLECRVGRVSFDPIKDTQDLARVHTLKAGVATIVDEDLVREHLDAMAIRIEEASGVSRLPMGEDGEEQPDGEEPAES